MRTMILLTLAIGIGCSRAVPVEEIDVDTAAAAALIDDYQPGPDDWPNWRGPSRNGMASSSPPPLRWSEDENIAWRTPVPGRGHASPVVVGDLVLLSSADEHQQQQFMLAFDRATGKEIWRVVLHESGFPSQRELHQKGTNANGTVACDEGLAFVAYLNERSIVASAVTLDGNIAWQTPLGSFNSKFGYAPSPVVYGPYVIFAADNQGGGYLAAVHRKSGKIAWRKKRSLDSTYSSPVVATVAGRDQLLISGGNRICSYDPATGEELWTCPGASEATCGTLVWKDDVAFASGGYPDRQTLAIRADGSAEILWTNDVKLYEPSMVVVGDELYAITDNGIAYCWDTSTGDQHWRKRLGGSFSASPVYCDGKIYAQQASGKMIVFNATSAGYQEVASNQLGDEALASPAICGGQLFVRVAETKGGTRQEYLYCIADQSDAEQRAISSPLRY